MVKKLKGRGLREKTHVSANGDAEGRGSRPIAEWGGGTRGARANQGWGQEAEVEGGEGQRQHVGELLWLRSLAPRGQ